MSLYRLNDQFCHSSLFVQIADFVEKSFVLYFYNCKPYLQILFEYLLTSFMMKKKAGHRSYLCCIFIFSAAIVFLSPMHTSKKRTISKVFLQHQIYWRTFRSPMSSLIPSNIFFMVNITRSYSSCIHSLIVFLLCKYFFSKRRITPGLCIKLCTQPSLLIVHQVVFLLCQQPYIS